ncbi:MAG: amidinotransferase [Hyphomicrobiales bacterium]|nr:amidinotransferase [Hyphomicrobiales bacterium]
MVRPHRFRVNAETAADNRFQSPTGSGAGLSRSAHREITVAAATLERAGVSVHLFEDESADTPDSVFPNNWFTTHAGGRVAVYPMKAASRRAERRADVVELLKSRYRVQEVVDYSGFERDGLFLEGTGAMVFDNVERVAYVARSDRADPVLLERFCAHFGFEPMVFDAADEEGVAVYHTNVMMCVGTDFALVALEMIGDGRRRAEVADRLRRSGRRVVEVSRVQVRRFVANALELRGGNGRLLALSTTAAAALDRTQLAAIEESVSVVALDMPTIEMAGGSVRCTLAGIHLAPR